MELNEVIKDCNSLIDTYKAANKNSWKERKSISNFFYSLLIQRWYQRWFSCVYNMNRFESYYSDTVAYVWMHTNIERSLVNGSSFYEN